MATELFRGPWPEMDFDRASTLWRDLDHLRELSSEDLRAALDDLINEREDVPEWLRLVIFHMAWAHLIIERPPENVEGTRISAARGKIYLWHEIEGRAEREGFADLAATVRSVVPFLQVVDEDDVNWTSRVLPGEAADRS